MSANLRKNEVRRCAALIVALIFCGAYRLDAVQAGTSTAPKFESSRIHRFEEDIERFRNLLKIPGISAVILKDQSVVWSGGFGFADLASKKPATKDTPYAIASLTKTFSATLIFQLAEQGKLSLDDPISRYSPDFRGSAIRVKHILSHTSEGTPGDSYSYNSDRYGAAVTQIVERVTGRKFRDALAKMIIEPLGMSSSVPGMDFGAAEGRGDIRLDDETRERYREIGASMARPYLLYGADEIVRAPLPTPEIDAASGLISTVMDLAKFDAAIDRHLLITRDMQDRAWSAFVSNAGRPLPHGLGWFVEDFHRLRLIWHYGYLPDAYSAIYLKVPARGLTLILLANSDALSSPFNVEAGIETSVFACSFLRTFVFADGGANDETACESESMAEVANWLGSKRGSVRHIARVDPRDLAPCAGRYRLPADRSATVSLKQGSLWIDLPQDIESQLFPSGRDRFFLKTMVLEMTFIRGSRGEVTEVEFSANGAKFRARKVSVPRESDKPWTAW